MKGNKDKEDSVCSIVLIKKEYFTKHPFLKEILDPGNIDKQSKRCYVFIHIVYKENNILIPFRTNMPDLRRFGRVGYPLPTETRPNAGLDYRKILIVNEYKYIEYPQSIKLPRSQINTIKNNIQQIEKEAISYVEGYFKAVRKGRELMDKKFKYSTLRNFHQELGLVTEAQEEAAADLLED